MPPYRLAAVIRDTSKIVRNENGVYPFYEGLSADLLAGLPAYGGFDPIFTWGAGDQVVRTPKPQDSSLQICLCCAYFFHRSRSKVRGS